MNSKPKNPIWPYLAVLPCLFALSVTAPRAWRQMARRASDIPTQVDTLVAPAYSGSGSANFETPDAEELTPRRPPTTRTSLTDEVAMHDSQIDDRPPLPEAPAEPPAPETPA